MPVIRPITLDDAAAYRAVRLEALQDSPSAFGSTWTRESQFTDEEWLQRARNMSGSRGIGYLSMDNGVPCGIAGAFFDEQDPLTMHIVSVWVAPAYRRTGVARDLLDAILLQARARGVRHLLLMVTSSNAGALAFYQSCGFTFTGRTEPYPNDPALIEYEMSRPVTAG
ncbi:GNAT family N-acetyltransferase [Paracidobacterium acidisoli]|uniref:GNAT family N-acetyltransferase n=1 Tax=Paracidobacterium acidisoli TaxID=2303751 RepID=A0A372IPZ2_9BACT|nr:GNAT family N-acetyltransferase [Paracidobacterium acidisoli]MBT9331376.1 GNAT family N-acetyltransferase [Paracidobacterium acidisoli]